MKAQSWPSCDRNTPWLTPRLPSPCVDDDGRAPGLAAVAADAHMRLLGGGVLCAFVEAVGCVELALVPRQADAERPIAAVGVRALLLDDVKLNTFQDWGF